MKVVIGLGNPGEKYQQTRHNIGAVVVTELAGQAIWRENKVAQANMAVSPDGSLLFVLPQTYMNRSGNSLAFIKKKYPQLVGDDLFVLHDDLDIPIGESKIQFEKGPHVHNGLTSLYQNWGSKAFWHVRIGVDGRAGIRNEPGQDYVLQSFTPEEKLLLEQMQLRLLPQLCKQLAII